MLDTDLQETSESTDELKNNSAAVKNAANDASGEHSLTLEEVDINNGENLKSPWGEWFLDKEAQRRKQVSLQCEERRTKYQADIAREKTRKKKADEVYANWLRKKQNELVVVKNKEKEQAVNQASIVYETQERKKSMQKIHVQLWNEKKHEEKLREEIKSAQEIVTEHNKVIDRQKKNCLAYDDWLAKKGTKSKNIPYSYGYDGGILVCYYDSASLPQPSFCNPKQWIYPE